MKDKQLIVVGASARAAAYSAQRAGFIPWWIDQFGDMDLVNRFPGRVVPQASWPRGIVDLISGAPDAPFIYTGALENHTAVLSALEKTRTLLGNSSATCTRLHDHMRLYEVLRNEGVPVPDVSGPLDSLPEEKRWLQKPSRSAGGYGIGFVGEQPQAEDAYMQEFIEGESRSAVFIGTGKDCRLLGVTRQLVGEHALHAAAWSYCGSIGALEISAGEERQWLAMGNVLTAAYQLTGLFGIDAVCRDGVVYPVEINPRYTASVEVLELSTGINSLELHVNACLGGPLPESPEKDPLCVGKAYLFADGEFCMPGLTVLESALSDNAGITLADIPAPGTRIPPGHPVLTLLVRGPGHVDCYTRLLASAAAVYRCNGHDLPGECA